MTRTTKGGRISNRTKDSEARFVKTFLTPKELLRLLRVAYTRNTRNWCMILVAYRHGLRTSEVCALKLADVQDGSLSVQRLKGSLKTVQPLGSHPSEPLLNEVEALRKWLVERPKGSSDTLFTSRNGGALHKTQFFKIFQATAKEAKLPNHKRHPRILKYSLVAHLLAQNVSFALINQVVGHVSMNSTLQYVKTTDGQASAAAQGAITEIF
jgi:site-specific recombinase XerD